VMIIRHDGDPRLYGSLDDGPTLVNVGSSADNVTYGVRTRAITAHGSSDHEFYTVGVSRGAAATAVAAEPATEMLHFGRRPDGVSPLAFELHGFAVVRDRIPACAVKSLTAEMAVS
jgi:hypothetical protein